MDCLLFNPASPSGAFQQMSCSATSSVVTFSSSSAAAIHDSVYIIWTIGVVIAMSVGILNATLFFKKT